ncbi:MAG: glutamine--fructose-6-phosphate transaminase (isomerizing) [SAR202 cluster bacterium]|nr:glutamine--fructose-6-phosphate transaminase (isomerizing) [SAR202 cluster bacterium]
MCGIIGYTGQRPAAPILMKGLSSLEYRGYDSAGIAVLAPNGEPIVHKTSGKLSRLKEALRSGLPEGTTGIGHTRWATHGGPTDFNAHPHTDCQGDVMVAHNGIVENYMELKSELQAQGHVFQSQTDAECIPHLIESYLHKEYSLEDALRATAVQIRGANAIVALSKNEPDKIVAVRLGNAGGIVVGYGEDEMLLASDLPALLTHTRNVVYLTGGELATVTQAEARYSLLDGSPIEKVASRVPYDAVSVAKAPYPHFMLKEINEQPEVVIDTLRGRVSFDVPDVTLEDFPFTDEEINSFERVVVLGMGTSLHTAMVGRTWMESLTRIATEADNSSEFRYRDPVVDERTLVVSISQSGETADTLAAMEEASKKGARQITLCNYGGTQTTRIADGTVLIRAGLEIGVAASKTFVCSLTALYLLALHLGIKRGTLGQERLGNLVKELAQLPHKLGTLLSNQSQYEALARRYFDCTDFLFLGRGINFPLAMEGALKLKEISYIHAEGYPAGEMKHGPISLIDENMPVVTLIPEDDLYEKMLNNVNEVKARGGRVLAVATEGDTDVLSRADDVIYIPQASSMVTPMLMAVPMQLLAYQIAVRRGCDVDQPRNLAKSVTVE